MQFRKGVILLLGPSLKNRGGMAVSERVLLNGWQNQSHSLELLVTHRDGSTINKLFVFILSLVNFVYRVIFTDISVVLVYFVSGFSFFRKSIFILFAKAAQKKVVLNCHLGDFDVFYNSKPLVVRKYITYILNLADELIVLGSSDVEIFKKVCSVKYYKIIPNSINCPPASVLSDKDKMIVCTMGTLGFRKGTYDLLGAIPMVLREFPETEFWLCGDGEIEKCKKIIANQGLSKSVKLLGYVTDGKENIYRSSTIFVLPSYVEGMPWSILEAMSYGLPVIASRVNAIPDLVDHGKTGFLIEPGDITGLAENMRLLLRNHQMRSSFGLAARNKVQEEFSVQKMIKDYEETLLQVMK